MWQPSGAKQTWCHSYLTKEPIWRQKLEMVSPHCTVQPGKVLIFFDVISMWVFLKSHLFKKQQNLCFSHF